MKVSHFIRAASLIVLSTTCAQADAVLGVENIEIAGTAGVGINITSPTFYGPDEAGSVFNLPTLGFKEELVDGNWWDVVIKVTLGPNSPNEPVMIGFDKEVCNHTTVDWTDFHITLGTGSGGSFDESTESDGLFFKTNPEPFESLDRFVDPPMFDEPVAPDNLWWFRDAMHPGIPVNGQGRFLFGVTIPANLFVPDPTGGNPMATITLRQHASIPEPSSFALLIGMCAIGASRWTRRRDVA